MAKRIVAKDILLTDLQRNLRSLDSFVKKHNSITLARNIKTSDLINALRAIDISFKSFYFREIDNMSKRSVIKAYNYNSKLFYYVVVPMRNNTYPFGLIEVVVNGTNNVYFGDKNDISYQFNINTLSYLDSQLKLGNGFLLVTTKPIRKNMWNYNSGMLELQNLDINERIKVIEGDTQPVNFYNVKCRIGNSKKIYSISNYEITRYNTVHLITDYLIDKSGYNRYKITNALWSRLITYKQEKVTKLFSNQEKEQELYADIRNALLSISQIHVVDKDHLIKIKNTIEYSLTSLVSKAHDILYYKDSSTFDRLKSFNNLKTELANTVEKLKNYTPVEIE